MSTRTSQLLSATFLVALLLGCGAAGPPPASAPSPLLGKPVPRFHRDSINVDATGTEARGRTTVIKFFAKYCEPCKRTLPAVQRLHETHENVSVIGIAEDEHASDAREMIQRYGLTFPVVHDSGNVLAGRFRVRELPVTFLVDENGTIRFVAGPDQDENDLERAIDTLK